MKATFVFKLGSAGRLAAARAGLPREQCVEDHAIAGVEIPAELEHRIDVNPDGSAIYKFSSGPFYYGLDAPIPDVAAAEAFLAEVVIKSKQEAEEKAQRDADNAVLDAKRHADRAREREEWKQREEKQAEDARVREEQDTAVRNAWIEEHGSPKLKRCVVEGIDCKYAYLQERLAKERPGWRWETSVYGTKHEVRNPPMTAFNLLDKARELEPKATLYTWTIDVCDDDEDPEDCPGFHGGYNGYVASAYFLGHEILFGGPRKEDDK